MCGGDTEVDPFSCFGSDSDSDGDSSSSDNNVGSNHALLPANLAGIAYPKKKEPVEASNEEIKLTHNEDENENAVKMWPTHPPLYMGPMKVVHAGDVIGGGRGYAASRDLEPGTVLLVEEPLMGWPKDKDEEESHGLPSLDLLVRTVRCMLCREDAGEVVQLLEPLHPSRVHVDALYETMTNQDSKHETKDPKGDQDWDGRLWQWMRKTKHYLTTTQTPQATSTLMDELLQYAQTNKLQCCTTQQYAHHSGTPPPNTLLPRLLQTQDLLRILLALQCNSFTTGLYLHYAMFNHDCHPNCLKLKPLHTYSEVRTTRWVKKGEALTLDYFSPGEQTHGERRTGLWDQHFFDIGPLLFADVQLPPSEGDVDGTNWSPSRLLEMELVHGKLPPVSTASPAEFQKQQHNIETDQDQDQPMDLDVLQRVQNALTQLEQEEHSLPSASTPHDDSFSARALALELASYEWCQEAKLQLANPYHILMVRGWKLHVACADRLLRDVTSSSAASRGTLTATATATATTTTPAASPVDLVCRAVTSALHLLHLQLHSLNYTTHPDVATTYHDLWRLSEVGLAWNAPLFVQKMKHVQVDRDMTTRQYVKTISGWSRQVHEFRKEYERIQAFYPEDVESYVALKK